MDFFGVNMSELCTGYGGCNRICSQRAECQCRISPGKGIVSQ